MTWLGVNLALDDLEDRLRMSFWDWHRSRIGGDGLDANGRTLKVGVDKHAPSCADDDGRFKCECGLETA